MTIRRLMNLLHDSPSIAGDITNNLTFSCILLNEQRKASVLTLFVNGAFSPYLSLGMYAFK
jgi:hypothetical protein